MRAAAAAAGEGGRDRERGGGGGGGVQANLDVWVACGRGREAGKMSLRGPFVDVQVRRIVSSRPQ